MAADLHAGFIALNRFGLGSRRGGDLAAAASDPRGFLRAELEQPGIAALEAPDLPRTAVALKILFTDQEQQRLQRLAADMTIQTASLEESPGRRAHRRRQNRKRRRSRRRQSSKSSAPKRRRGCGVFSKHKQVSSSGSFSSGLTISASRR
jgi:uncharacterized protein (DUF1800 family)